MANITKLQVQTINNKCDNGWKLDLEYYLYHGEKQLIKHIDLDSEHYLKFSLRYNFRNQIVLSINKYHIEKGTIFASAKRYG